MSENRCCNCIQKNEIWAKNLGNMISLRWPHTLPEFFLHEIRFKISHNAFTGIYWIVDYIYFETQIMAKNYRLILILFPDK